MFLKCRISYILAKEKAELKKKEEEEEDLSEEDKQLKDELELCVTRLGNYCQEHRYQKLIIHWLLTFNGKT